MLSGKTKLCINSLSISYESAMRISFKTPAYQYVALFNFPFKEEFETNTGYF
jgi:hypothetical protein